MKLFYVDEILGLATLSKGHTLSLPSGAAVDLSTKGGIDLSWRIVACIANCWLVCGDRDIDGQVLVASISQNGDVRSTLKLKSAASGYMHRPRGAELAGIYSMHRVCYRGSQGVMLAIERGGCCHLLAVVDRRLSKLQSIDSIVNADVVKDRRCRVVVSVTATGTKGGFIVAGVNWTKLVILKLK